MFKKFSRTLIIFAVAMCLIVLSQTESNAQVVPGVCGGCGQRPCEWVFVNGNWIWGSYEAVYDIQGAISLPVNMFVESKMIVVDSCLVCQNPENLEELSLSWLPRRTFTAKTYSSFDDFELVGLDFYELTEEVCSTTVEEGAEEACDECVGRVTDLTLRYTGSHGARIAVYQHRITDPVFNGWVEAGAEFSFSGATSDGTLGAKIDIKVNQELNAQIHTSCSQPIGPGLVSGDFILVSGFSRDGGLLCPLDSGAAVSSVAALDSGECILPEFQYLWGLTSSECSPESWLPHQFLIKDLYLTGRLLNNCTTFDADGNPIRCIEEDIICLRCQTDEPCDAWNADGEVTYDCYETACGGPVETTDWVGATVTGTVLMGEGDEETYAWPVSNTPISLDNIEFINVKTNTTISADFTANTLILKYENTSDWPNITIAPLRFTFEFESGFFSAINLVSSTFSQDINAIYTSNSITLEVPIQNTNPGEIFTAIYELTF